MKQLNKKRIKYAAILLAGGLAISACRAEHGHPSPMMFDAMAYKLDLSESQETKWFAIRDAIKQARQAERNERQNTKTQILAQLQAETIDQQAVLAQLKNEQQKRLDQAPELIAKIAEFHATLNAEQKTKIAELIEKMGKRHHGKNHGKEGRESRD
jgi:uncharacterized membrane protein